MTLVAAVSAAAVPTPSATPADVAHDPLVPEATPAPPPPCDLTWPLPVMVQPSAWMDHHYPTRTADGVMVRYDGATNAFYDGHRGLDLPVAEGTRVLAAADGLVTWTALTDNGGYSISVAHAGCRTIYYHNTALFARTGDHVSRGQVIALSGNTGNSTGPHLHLEVRDLLHLSRAIDPFGWTGSTPDPWSWDEGVLWRGGHPELVAATGPTGALWRPQSDLEAALAQDGAAVIVGGDRAAGDTLHGDGRLSLGAIELRLPVSGPAIGLSACADAACVLDLRGDVFVARAAGARLAFTLPAEARATALACAPDAPARCVVMDTAGELYPAVLEGGGAPPSLLGAPGIWPLPAAPAGLSLEGGDPAVGTLTDSQGNIYRFGPQLLAGAERTGGL